MVFYRQNFFSRLIQRSGFLSVKLLLLSFIVSGCALPAVISPGSPSDTIPASITGAMDENDVLSAIVKIDIMSPGHYYPVKAALIIKRPSYLRLEVLPVIGVPDFFLAASPEKMSIFIPSQGKFYYGQPTGANLRKFLPWQFNIEDIVMIFSGTYPHLGENNITYRSYREENLLCTEMKASSGSSQIVWVGENNRLLKIVRKDETGKEAYTVQYLYNETLSSVPEKITIRMADGITSLTVKYSDVRIEQAKDLSVFDLPVPAKVKAIPLE
jgi:hypothetical protein